MILETRVAVGPAFAIACGLIVLSSAVAAQAPPTNRSDPPALPAPSAAPPHAVGRIATLRLEAPCTNLSAATERAERFATTVILSFSTPEAITELISAETGQRSASAERNIRYATNQATFEGTRLFNYTQVRDRERRTHEFDDVYRTRANWQGSILEFTYTIAHKGISPFGDTLDHGVERVVRVAFPDRERCEATFLGYRQRLVYGERTVIDRWCVAPTALPGWSCTVADRPR